MVHKPKHKVHSFRGLLGDGGQDEINLERQNANVAYRIVKLQLMINSYTSNRGSFVQIWKERQDSVSTGEPTIDFSDNHLLATAVQMWYGTNLILSDQTIIFDNILFSRNIWVTHTERSGGGGANYYIELEEVPVSASTLMQLKLGVARKLNLQQD